MRSDLMERPKNEFSRTRMHILHICRAETIGTLRKNVMVTCRSVHANNTVRKNRTLEQEWRYKGMVQILAGGLDDCSSSRVTLSPSDAKDTAASAPEIDSAVNNPKLRALRDYWATKCRGDILPSFRNIRPEEIPHLLSSLLIWDVVNGGRDFVIRLAGSTVEEVFGRSMRGLTVGEVIGGQNLPVTLTQMLGVVVEAQPVYMTYYICPTQGSCLRIERILLPLASDGAAVDCLMGGFDFKILDACSKPRSSLPYGQI